MELSLLCMNIFPFHYKPSFHLNKAKINLINLQGQEKNLEVWSLQLPVLAEKFQNGKLLLHGDFLSFCHEQHQSVQISLQLFCFCVVRGSTTSQGCPQESEEHLNPPNLQNMLLSVHSGTAPTLHTESVYKHLLIRAAALSGLLLLYFVVNDQRNHLWK